MTSLEQPARLQPQGEGFTLRDLRRARDLSLRDVERLVDVHRGLLSRVERGIELPSPALLERLSELYGIPAEAWVLRVEYRAVIQGGTT